MFVPSHFEDVIRHGKSPQMRNKWTAQWTQSDLKEQREGGRGEREGTSHIQAFHFTPLWHTLHCTSSTNQLILAGERRTNIDNRPPRKREGRALCAMCPPHQDRAGGRKLYRPQGKSFSTAVKVNEHILGDSFPRSR